MGAVAIVLFAIVAREARCKDYLPAAAALAFMPLYYISSVTSKDYVWCLAFALACLLTVSRGKPLLAGLFLGLAMGCRITYGAMALPLCLLLVNAPGQRKPLSRIILFGMSSALTATFVFFLL